MQTIKRLRNSNGSTLMVAMVIGIMLLAMATTLTQFLSNGSNRQKRSIETIKAFWANEAGVNLGLRYVTFINNLSTVNEALNIPADNAVNGYAPAITVRGRRENNIIKNAITASTQIDQTNISTVSTAQASFKNMQYWTLFEDATMTGGRWTNRIVYGNFHTNGYIRVGIDMESYSHVTGTASAAGRYYSYSGGDQINFPEGYRYGMVRVDDDINNTVYSYNAGYNASSWNIRTRFPDYRFSGRVDFLQISPDSGEFNIPEDELRGSYGYFTYSNSGYSNLLVHLRNDTFDLKYKTSSGWTFFKQNLMVADYPIVKTDKDLYVYGTLKGRMSIVTTKSLFIAGNICYSDTDLKRSSNTNVLALVCKDSISIPSEFPFPGSGYNFDANDTTRVYASLFAQKGKLWLNSTAETAIQPMRNMVIYGGLTSHHPGNTLNVSCNRGLRVIYRSDPRLADNTIAAPGMPQMKKADPEISTAANTRYMNVLHGMDWSNTQTATN